MTVMSWNRLSLEWRRFATGSALVLFLAGSNFCLLAALGGTPMTCLASPTTSAPAKMSHCGHPMAPVKGPGSRGAMVSPCCLNAALVSAPQIHKADVTAPALQTLEPVVLTDPAALTAARAAPNPDESPPARPESAAPHYGRAPPLA